MSRGIERERAVRAWYADRDWLAFRAPASLGVADVVAMRPYYEDKDMGHWIGTHVELCEVKSTAGGPYEHFGPAERQRLSDAARFCGARAVLAWWPPRGKLRFIPEEEWPRARAASAPDRASTASTVSPVGKGETHAVDCDMDEDCVCPGGEAV